MRPLTLLTCLILSCFSYSQKIKPVKFKKGRWIAELALNDQDKLPFNLIIKKKRRVYSLAVENADEVIELESPVQKSDSLFVRFPFFNSELIITSKRKKEIIGCWVNYNKGPDYKVPLIAVHKKASRFKQVSKSNQSKNNISGKWEVTFEPGTNSAYPALGIFEQVNTTSQVKGTFLTETGDYRYLDGNVTNDSLFLSCFDGSHAFLFKAKLNESSLDGKFFSGTHWNSSWIGKRNEDFQLNSPEELTYVVDDKPVEFELNNLEGKPMKFPSDDYKDKVVIVQIMGTWCPNCLDETIFFKELYDNYHEKGLEIISIGYETGENESDYVTSINRLKDKLDLDFNFLVGGSAKKGLASKHFNMLNEIISFPTSIYIGRDGKVKLVHTGFNGPSTGSYYYDYVRKTHSLIENLLAD